VYRIITISIFFKHDKIDLLGTCTEKCGYHFDRSILRPSLPFVIRAAPACERLQHDVKRHVTRGTYTKCEVFSDFSFRISNLSGITWYKRRC